MKKFYKFMISREAGIYWQIYFGVLIIVGSVVPQGDVKQIENAKIPSILKSVIISTQSYDLYKSPIFLASLAVFFVTLSISTYMIVYPIFVNLFKITKTPAKKHLLRSPLLLEIKGADFEQAKKVIKKRRFRLINEKEGLLHFERGKLSKTSAMFSHISLFTILLGVSLSILTSFKSSAPLVPFEKISIKNIVARAESKGKWVTSESENWSIKVNSFRMVFHPNGMVKQYYSDLSVLDNKTNFELDRQTISVNEPLVYNGVYFYQASWGVSHLAVVIDGVAKNIALQPLKSDKGNVSDKIKLGKTDAVFFMDKKNQVFVFDLDGQPINQLIKNDTVNVNGAKVELKDIVLFTGLQIKKDQGIPLVYFGFILLIVALIINYFSHNQLWLMENDGKYYLVGKANRSNYLLEREINLVADLIEVDKTSLVKNTTNV